MTSWHGSSIKRPPPPRGSPFSPLNMSPLPRCRPPPPPYLWQPQRHSHSRYISGQCWRPARNGSVLECWGHSDLDMSSVMSLPLSSLLSVALEGKQSLLISNWIKWYELQSIHSWGTTNNWVQTDNGPQPHGCDTHLYSTGPMTSHLALNRCSWTPELRQPMVEWSLFWDGLNLKEHSTDMKFHP